MKTFFFLIKIFFLLSLAGILACILTVGALFVYLEPKLPAVDSLREIRLQVPARIYSKEGKLISEFGEMRRIPVQYSELPPKLVLAFLAAEDDRFFKHIGVDMFGLLRAALHLVRTGSKGQGGSTITMQVARNFFLSAEKTYLRKINEILLSLKIERELSKEEILELYLNRIFLGHRAYGIGAAAQIYYGKTVAELDLAQMAMLAGLPKAPSTINPVTNPQRSRSRRSYVLRRMLDEKFINQEEHDAANLEPITTKVHTLDIEVSAPWFAEMVRIEAMQMVPPEHEKPIGDSLYTHGYELVTSLDAELQQQANLALRGALYDYDRRHGYRGPEAKHQLGPSISYATLDSALEAAGTPGDLKAGIVTNINSDKEIATVYIGSGAEIELLIDGVSWARKYLTANTLGPRIKSISDVLSKGDQIRVIKPANEEHWQLAQIPAAEGALVAMNPKTGEIVALAGGFDFSISKFNRATQAQRQAGSALKPFIYSVALENGYTAASIINDAPVVFNDPALENTWRPENYGGRFYGPTRLREALAQSRNLVSIRLLQGIGIQKGVQGLTKFGFERQMLPKDLSLALGSASLTPLQLTTAYCAFANGGYRVTPSYLTTLRDANNGKIIWQAAKTQLCDEHCGNTTEANTTEVNSADEPHIRYAERIISPQVAFIMDSMLRDVITRGTARRATALGRPDIAGKTGTTNEVKDAWFVGYHPELAVSAWIGFDQSESMGNSETGGRSALPMWIEFMRGALTKLPRTSPIQPPGIVSVRINRTSGLQSSPQDPDSMFEYFIDGTLPPAAPASSLGTDETNSHPGAAVADSQEEIF